MFNNMTNKEIYSKIWIIVEEVDESQYWLEVIKDANLFIDIIAL